MTRPVRSDENGYDSFYRDFDSPLMSRLRQEAYGEDLGQHSWVTASELREDILRLELSRTSRFLDLGCGPCGPLTFVLSTVGCRGTGTELSAAALEVGLARAERLGVASLISLNESDLNQRLPFAASSFDAVMALDVVLHLRDRAQFFREIVKIMASCGKFLFTDAGVLTGAISNQEVVERSIHGYTQFVAPGFNESLLKAAGFQIIESEDRTESALKNAVGRLKAMLTHRTELIEHRGVDDFARQQRYLETVAELSRRRVLSRIMYLAKPAS